MPNKKKKIGQTYLDRIAQRNIEDARRRQRAFDNLLIYGTSTPITFGGGSSSGGGASGEWDSTFDKYGPDRIVYTPVIREVSFGEKFADARRRGLDTFDFNGRPIAVKMSDNPKYTKAEYEVENLGTLRQVKDSQGKLYNDSTMFYPAPAIYGEFDRDKNPNVYDLGGPFNRYWQPPTSLGFNTNLSLDKGLNNAGLNLNSIKPTLSTSGLGSAMGIIGGIAGGLSDLYQGINADTSDIENAVDRQIDALGNIKYTNATSMDDLMNKQSSYRGLEANHKASEFYKGPSNGEIFTDALTKGISTAVSSSSTGMLAPFLGGARLITSLVGGLIGRNKQQNAADEAKTKLNAEERRKNAFMEASYRNDANNLVAKNNRTLMAQIGAYGGPLGISLNPVHGAIDFMQNEELLDYLEGDLSKNNKKTSLPEFAFGGALGGYGGDWSNGITFIKSGGTHGQNPLGGVPVGLAQDGMPNLVEEGEAIWNDYVFSNRIKVPKRVLEKYKFGGNLDLSFAQAVEKAQKNLAERPNDPIEQRGVEAILTDLMQEQEAIRQKKAEREQKQMEDMVTYAANGGGLSRDKDYGSKKKPYPKVKSSDFAGGGRSYPIPTKADAIDALRLAGLHGRSDVKAKVYKKYPELKKALGGHLFWPGGPENPPYYSDIVYGRGLGAIDEGSLMDNMMIMGPQDYYIPNFYSNKLGANAGYREVADKPKSTIQPKPFAQSPIKQNPTPIYLSDDSGMNRYIAATNPLAIHDLAVSDNLRFKYNGLDTTYNATSTTNTNNKGQRDLLPTSGWQTSLRYLPAIAPAISLAYSLFKKPDYSYADELDAAGNAYAEMIRNNGKVSPKFIGDYMAYNPFDRLFYANELGAQQAATRSAIINAGNANRGATMAALLGSGYNDNVGLGKLFREGEEYNLAQRQKVTEFNRATNQYNSTLDMQAQEINANKDERLAAALLENKYKSLAMKQAIDNQRGQDISLALTNLFNNLGAIGEDYTQRYWINALANSGYFGTLNNFMKDIAADGGKLNRKKKKGLTI